MFEILGPELGFEPPMAVFSGAVPTADEVALVRDRRLAVNFVEPPPEHRGLEFLDQFIPFLEDLCLASAARLNLNRILRLEKLRRLSLSLTYSEPLDLTQLPNLMTFAGYLEDFESVLDVRTLESLHLQRVVDGQLRRINAPLKELELVDPIHLPQFPELAYPNRLNVLTIVGSRDVNLRGIAQCQSLTRLNLRQCREVMGLDELLSISTLRYLVLENCGSLEPQEALLGLHTERVAVRGRNPFGAEFRRQAEASESEWVYFGRAKKPPQ